MTRNSISGKLYCAQCFCDNFEEETHNYIKENDLIPNGSTVVVGVSGGKDSSVLLTVLYKILY